MASPGLSSIIILSEIILLETSIIIGAGVYFLLRSKKNSRQLMDSLKKFTDSENERRSNLNNSLKKPEFMIDEKYNETINNILSGETDLFKNVVNAIHKNELNQLDSLGEDIEMILKPCENLLAGIDKPTTETTEKTAVIDVDDAIDDLLSDDDSDPDKDPELDLSTAEEVPSKEVASDDEIAEIPSELLDGGITDTTDEFDIDQSDNPDSSEPVTNK